MRFSIGNGPLLLGKYLLNNYKISSFYLLYNKLSICFKFMSDFIKYSTV